MGSLSPRSTSLPLQRGCPLQPWLLTQEPPIALSTDRDIHFYFSNGGPDSFSIFIWHQTECTLWSWTQKGDELKLMDSMDLSSSGFWRATRYLWKVHGLCLMTHSRSASSLKMNNSIFSLRSLTSKFFCVPDISKCTGHSFYAEPSFCKKLSH